MFPKPKEGKEEKIIEQIDIKSYYVKSQSDPNREPYLVYNSDSKGFMCDCMWWSIHMADCKHILLIKKTYNL